MYDGEGRAFGHLDSNRCRQSPSHPRIFHIRNLRDADRRGMHVLQPDVLAPFDRGTIADQLRGYDAIARDRNRFRKEAGPRCGPIARGCRGNRDEQQKKPKWTQARCGRCFRAAGIRLFHARTNRSIASATPSLVTSATTASATSRSSGGAEPIATPNPAALSSGASFHESPIASTSLIGIWSLF